MPELELTPHPDEQRSLAELRSEFRAQHLADLRSQYAGYHPVGWAMIGDPEMSRSQFTAHEWSEQMLRWLDAPCTQDFGLPAVPAATVDRLYKLAEESLLHESATWDSSVDGVTDHDAPPCADVLTMTDEQLCTYIDQAIEASANG